MRTTTASTHPHSSTTRSKTNFNGTLPFRLSSANQVCRQVQKKSHLFLSETQKTYKCDFMYEEY